IDANLALLLSFEKYYYFPFLSFSYFECRSADLLGSPVIRPADIETTALGAAFAAGLAIGVFKEEEIFASGERTKTSTTFKPVLNEEFRKKKAESWCRAVERIFNLADLSL
ncbi:hypothetical protein CISIN_1g0368922mg, partial [Citrus sinensis]